MPPNTKTVIIQHEQPISIATAPSWQQNDENNIRSIINKEAKVQPIITKRPKAILWTVSNPISKTKLNFLYETKNEAQEDNPFIYINVNYDIPDIFDV